MGKHFGRCALCGKKSDLTFEHIPPRAAFNSTPARPVSGDKLIGNDGRMPWDTTGLQYDNQQKGMGRYSLCKACNNKTGSWYGNAYEHVAHVVHAFFIDKDAQNALGMGIKEVYPLRFIKQVLSMFCSINNFADDRIEQLCKFVLDKEATNLDKEKYKLCMYFTKGNLMKYAPLSVILTRIGDKYESMAVSEVTAYPLGFVLYFDPTNTWQYEGVDITSFSDYRYNDICTMEVPICVKEVNDIFPTYYRTKEEIEECVRQNREWKEKHAGKIRID